MINSFRTYNLDDKFKAQARAHQFAFRDSVLNDCYEEKNPQVILSPDAARQGLIFCETYRDLILSKVGKFGTSPLFSNMLRSEHIPYNIFTPMEEDLDNAVALFNEIIGGGIAKILDIKIEFAGEDEDISQYLNDRTSFDAFIKYKTTDCKLGGIGIEVKYTENGYRIGDKERQDIEAADGKYRTMTAKSMYYQPGLDITMFIKANHLRQIWRNHLLGFAMLEHGDISVFHHIHLYPMGNEHFHNYALPEYETLLSETGKQTFIPFTYEDLFKLLPVYFKSPKQADWIQYLHDRYLF